MKKKESRLFGIRAVTDGDKRRLTGYAAKFNSLSEDFGGFREQIKPGAFVEALKKSDVRALYNHNSDMLPLGRSPETLRMVEDDTGLKVEIDLPDTQFARDLMVSVERGDVSQMSFGFSVAPDGVEWGNRDEQGKPTVRTLTKINRLYDVSPVVYPAYPDTEVAVRSLEKMQENAPVDYGVRKRKLELNEKTIK